MPDEAVLDIPKMSVADIKYHALAMRLAPTMSHEARMRCDLHPWDINSLSSDALVWFGRKVFYWIERLEKHSVDEYKAYAYCLSFYGIACPHPIEAREGRGSTYFSLGSGSYRANRFDCLACGCAIVWYAKRFDEQPLWRQCKVPKGVSDATGCECRA